MVEEEEEYFHFFCWKRRKNDILNFDMNDDDKGNGFHKFFKATLKITLKIYHRATRLKEAIGRECYEDER